jgi:hypothetical protein
MAATFSCVRIAAHRSAGTEGLYALVPGSR